MTRAQREPYQVPVLHRQAKLIRDFDIQRIARGSVNGQFFEPVRDLELNWGPTANSKPPSSFRRGQAGSGGQAVTTAWRFSATSFPKLNWVPGVDYSFEKLNVILTISLRWAMLRNDYAEKRT